MFALNIQQWIDRFGTVSRSAFDASGKRIGTQVGHVGGPNGIVVEMTYLVSDAEHPLSGRRLMVWAIPCRCTPAVTPPIDGNRNRSLARPDRA
jgi:hypothetical protein